MQLKKKRTGEKNMTEMESREEKETRKVFYERGRDHCSFLECGRDHCQNLICK